MAIVHEDEVDRLAGPSPGRARAAFAAVRGRDAVEAAFRARSAGGGARVVVLRCEGSPATPALIDDAVDALADAALGSFGAWYGDGRLAALEAEGPDFDELWATGVARLGLASRGVSAAWLRAARRLGRRGERPLPRGYTPAVQAEQLALALGPPPPDVLIRLEVESPGPDALHALARAAEWLAREAGAAVTLLAPDALADSPGLDGVNYDATRIRPRDPAPGATPGPGPAGASPAPGSYIGRPNPASGPELRLHERLERDAELAGLFRYNVRVPTARGTSPLVDLVWPEGGVVVEVDGYYHHQSEAMFAGDRNRDYELIVSGCVVLRLPASEVESDVALAVEKIRDVVRFRRGPDAPPGEGRR